MYFLWTDPSGQNQLILTVHWISWGTGKALLLTNKKPHVQFWQLEFVQEIYNLLREGVKFFFNETGCSSNVNCYNLSVLLCASFTLQI